MAHLQLASVIVQKERGNSLFQPGTGPNGGEYFLPWQELRAAFQAEGYELNTPDVNVGRRVAFELHLNAQRRVPVDTPCYAYQYEDPLVRPLNANRDRWLRYRKVWTWDETLIDGQHFIELEYPNDLIVSNTPGWDDRDLFCVMIASNKALRFASPRSLHERRVEIIRHFEREAPNDFNLYGRGWNIPAVRPGALGRLQKRFNEWRARSKLVSSVPPFPSWRGVANRKSDVLRRARFAICFENSRGNKGYITEKIFDCFTTGCVPVYAGTTHSIPPIPSNCYIDADAFNSPRELRNALHAVSRSRFHNYQNSIRDFLLDPSTQRYSKHNWCNTLVSGIIADISSGMSNETGSRTRG